MNPQDHKTRADDWRENGVVFPVSVLSAQEVSYFRDQLEDLEVRLGGRPTESQLTEIHLFYRWAYDLVMHPRILDAVEDNLGPDILVWACSVFTKYARDPSFVSWHQDGTYWGLSGGDVLTAWLALSPSTVANGCIRVVSGTQREPFHPHVETYSEHNALSRGQEVAINIDPAKVVDVELQPGEMSLHDVRLIHGSNPNASDIKRVGFTIRYVTPDVRPTDTEQMAVLARGKDRYRHFPLLESPPSLPIDEALAAHAISSERHMASLRKTKGAFN